MSNTMIEVYDKRDGKLKATLMENDPTLIEIKSSKLFKLKNKTKQTRERVKPID